MELRVSGGDQGTLGCPYKGFFHSARSTAYHYVASRTRKRIAELAPGRRGRQEVINHKTCVSDKSAPRGRQDGAKTRHAEEAPAPSSARRRLPARRVGRLPSRVSRRLLIIRLGCPPRWAARSASFRGDGWILWEITRPSARIGISHTTIIVYYATQAACTYIPNTRH